MWNRLGVVGVLAASIAMASPAFAADEAPSVALHGFADLSVKNDYITPRGLHVTSDGSTIQFLNGLVLVFPESGLSVVGGTWTDFNPGYAKANKQALNEFDWFVGVNGKLGKDWTAGVQYVEFISGPGLFKTEKNLEFSLAFDDSAYLKPISLKPYVKLFYAMSGDSTVVVGKRGDTFDVEIGATPSLSLAPYDIPLTLSMPTWVTVGPEGYWGGGGNAGVFSTGIKATYNLKLPQAAGSWSIYAGYQYYHLINDRLVLAQSLLNPGMTDRNLHLFQVGIGLGF